MIKKEHEVIVSQKETEQRNFSKINLKKEDIFNGANMTNIQIISWIITIVWQLRSEFILSVSSDQSEAKQVASF